MTSDPFQADVFLDWCGPLEQDAMFESFLNPSPAINEPKKPGSYISYSGLSDTTPARERRDAIIKVIEVKTDLDGVNVCYTGETVSLESAFQRGLIAASDYANVLERQNTPRDAAVDVSPFEPVQEDEPYDVNSFISKCLSRNKSQISPRDVHTLKLSSPQLDDLIKPHDMDILNVDAALQCDLRNSSSTLVVLGSQQQYLGLVLPPSEEIQMISESFEDNELSAEFTSSLFSNKEKIAAFYIPHFSEVVDFDVAIQKGLIDMHTAEVLKTIEIPDEVPDVDRLNEKFSSWLMYRKLTVEGCFHAAHCLKVDSVPSPAEAEQLFISYLMINSYIDAQTGKRVVILDSELSKMVKIFLEEPASSEDGNKRTTSLELIVLDQADVNLKLHREEEMDMGMEDNKHTCEPPYFVSSLNGNVPFRVEAHTGDQAVNHHPVEDVAEDNDTNMDQSDPHMSEKLVCLKNPGWTKPGEFVQMIYGNGSEIDDADGDSGESSHQALRHNITESICSESDVADSFEAEFLSPDYLSDDEQQFVIEILEAQVEEEEDILDIPSARHAGVDAALSENLVDAEAFVKLLNSHSDDTGSTEGDEWDSMSDFKETASGGYNSSYSAYFLAEKQTISRSGCSISISESYHTGVTENECVASDLETSPYSQDECPPCTAGSNILDFTDANGNEKQPMVRKGSEAAEDTEFGREMADKEVDCERTGNVEEMSRDLDRCLPATDDRSSQMFSCSLWSQVTADHHTSKSSFPTGRSDSQGMSNSQLTGASDEGENTQTSEERGKSVSLTQHPTFTPPPDPDSPLFVEKVLIAESDSEVESQECSEGESDTLTPSHVLMYENKAKESETSALELHLSSEPAPSRHYSSTGVEDIMSHSRKEDGTTMTSPQPAEAQSERLFCVEQEADQGFPQLAISSDEVILPDHFESITVDDSECEDSQTAIRTSPEAAPVDQHVSASQFGSVGDEPSTGFTHERQQISGDREETSDVVVAPGEMSSEQAEPAASVESGPETPVDNNRTAEDDSEHVPFSQSDLPNVPSDCCVTSVPLSGAWGVGTAPSDEREVRDFQSAEDVGSIRSILANTSQLLEKDVHKNDKPHALLESRHPDLLVDLLKRNAHNLESKEAGETRQEVKVNQKAEEFPSIQQQLLQVLHTVTSSQDLSMLQEVMQSLNMALGSNTQEDQRHLLDSIKEESSEGEDEGSAEDDSPQSSASSNGCKVKQTEKKVQFKSVT